MKDKNVATVLKLSKLFRSVISLMVENAFLSISGLAFSIFKFYSAFETFGLNYMAVVSALHSIFAVTMLAAALIVMKDYKLKIFSEIATHQSNISQFIKSFLTWLLGLEFLVFLVVDVKLFTTLGVAVFVVVMMLFLNYFIAGLKQGNEYNKQFEE